jgi:capsular exopolysaccharide synthesis family protein
MDYIEKAVAMLERSGTLVQRDEVNEQPEEIKYTQSRIVSLSNRHLQQNRIITPETDKGIVNAYKVLRTRVLQQMQQNEWTTLAITSPKPSEGKTLTSINLAITLAMKPDFTVLLADLDFRKPSLHTRFGFKPEHGLSDYLAGRVRLEDVFISPGIERLVLLPELHGESRSSEALSSAKMMQLVDELKSRYPSRIIIFDLPPVLVGDDVLAFSNIADAVLLVVHEGKTTTDDLGRSIALLEKSNLIGAVLNRSSSSNEFSHYGY